MLKSKLAIYILGKKEGFNMQEMMEFGKRTEGRKRIIADGLTIELTAQKIIKWYESI